MKLSTAIVALTFFTAEARVNRRTQDAAADVAMVPDAALDAVAADNASSGGGSGSNSCPCEEEEISGVIDIIANNDGEVGGFAFEWNPTQESVSFKDSIGSSFSIDACETFEKPCDDCRVPKTILYCPMIPGQRATFELTDTNFGSCPTRGRHLQDSTEAVTKDRNRNLGIEFYIVTDYDYCCDRRNLKEGSGRELACRRRALIEGEGRELGCRRNLENGNSDITATLKCGFRNIACTSGDSSFAQTTRDLYGSNYSPLGSEYEIDLRDCTVDYD